MYKYNISGYYLAIDDYGHCEKRHFSEDVEANDNVDAMRMVIGEFAWQESLQGNTFKLDTVHYECLQRREYICSRKKPTEYRFGLVRAGNLV